MKPVKNVTSATVIAAASGVPQAGQLIGDRYRLDRPLERGAMGSVWRAEQVRLRAPVAVKFLDPSLIGDREMHDRFIQEARSAAAVRSAHVVQVFDYGSEGGVPYIAMELLDGENLDARLGSRGTLTPAELDRLFAELARGIGQAHAIGVIHRDLKPGNIFIAREGEHEVTKIVDFGIAKVKASALRLTRGIGTQLGTLLGTPQYMSPEQVRGSGSIDHRTDLWALAIIACECLTGRCPFSGATIGDLTVQICTERPPAPSTLGPVPPGFDQWFFKATHKKPNKRFQTVEEMAERLHAVLAPALATAPGTARAGRLITLPSRSEVRLAYSAVVTWKGYVMSRLGQGWAEVHQLMQRVVHHLAIQWEVAEQRVSELMASERMAFLRPLVQRHGMFASVALLCCGILLLGLTTRNSDPVVVSPVQAASAERVVVPAALGAAATPRPEVVTTLPSELAANEVSAVPADGVVGDAPTNVAAAPSANTGLDTAASEPRADVEADDAPAIERVAARDPEPRAAPAPVRAKAPAVHAAPAAAKSSGDEPAEPMKKSKPITKAMAQAAAKILTADDLVASAPPAKKAAPPPARATAAAPAPTPKPRAARPAAQAKASSSSHPFDDRL
ncbi:MAG TPA: protein kinase [Polyangiaceae bacterium]|nr:protein kinase [Polyangiaceae bacterium]